MSQRSEFADRYTVPRETMKQFDTYAALLVDWQTRMNLVGPSTLPDIWTRHFADSAQLADLVPSVTAETIWMDMGSGAGFPALALALLKPGVFHLVESTMKKARFLQTVADAVGLADRVVIHAARIEAVPPIGARIITARACAALGQLFEWGLRHGANARWLLLKGQSVGDEIAAARATFRFEAELISSRTDARGHIVVAHDVRRLRR